MVSVTIAFLFDILSSGIQSTLRKRPERRYVLHLNAQRKNETISTSSNLSLDKLEKRHCLNVSQMNRHINAFLLVNENPNDRKLTASTLLPRLIKSNQTSPLGFKLT